MCQVYGAVVMQSRKRKSGARKCAISSGEQTHVEERETWNICTYNRVAPNGSRTRAAPLSAVISPVIEPSVGRFGYAPRMRVVGCHAQQDRGSTVLEFPR